MDFDYAERRAVLEDPVAGQLSPHSYLICTLCAEKLTPPRGWELEDHRDKPQLFLAENAEEAGAETDETNETDETDDLVVTLPTDDSQASLPKLEAQRAFPQRG